MKLWPDLSRFGFGLGVLYEQLPDGKRQANGLYLEALSDVGDVAGTSIEALRQAGFTPIAAVGDTPFRMETTRTKFSMADLASWFPGFDIATDMRERHPSFLVTQPAAVLTDWHVDSDWPRQSDLNAVDIDFNLHGWEYPVEAFERVAAFRVIVIDGNGRVVNPEVTTERVLDVLFGPDELLKRRPEAAQRLLGRIAAAAHEALKSANVVAIERVGDNVLMPPLRVFREGEAITSAFADHRRLVETALSTYPVPDVALKTYRGVAELDAPDREADLALLARFPANETVAEWYERDEGFGSALNRLIENFEYPDHSHKTIGELYRRLSGKSPETDPAEQGTVSAPPAWHTSLPGRGLPITADQLQSGGFSRVPFVLAEDAYAAMTRDQLHGGMAFYAYYMPSAGGVNGVVRLVPDDQNMSFPWTLLNGEAVRVGMISKERVVAKLAEWLQMAPILGDEKLAPTIAVETPTINEGDAALEKARRTLRIYTSGRGDLYQLAGHAKASVRAHVMADLLGVEDVPQAKAGITALRDEFYRRLGLTEGTLAAKESRFYGWVNAGSVETAPETAQDGSINEPASVPVEVIKNPKVKRLRTPVTDDRIDDVGVKIGGARKDFYRRALCVDDLPTMNEMERTELVKKANIWPWSVKESLESGAEPCVVQWIKTLRRNIREYGDSSRFGGTQTPEEFIRGVAMLRDGIGSPKTRIDLIDNLKAFRTRLYEEKLWTAFRHPMTGAKLDNRASGFADDMYRVVAASGRKAWEMADTQISQRFDSTTRTYGDPEFSPSQWVSSKAEYFEREPQWGRSKLMPARRAVVVEDTEVVMPERPHLANLKHSGFSDVRGGRDIEASELLTRFGFRAIEFGNWVPQDERQMVINLAFDGMHALCETLGMEPQMASLYGELALAFGSRGRGGKNAAAAHYEPMRTVINLTRINGAGSLMHEWKHAFDNYLGKLFSRGGAPS